MLQVRANRVCTRISFFVSKTVRKIRAFFYPWPKNSSDESTASSADGRLTRHRQGMPARPPAALRKFGSARPRWKKRKANFVDSRKLLLRGYKFKDTKHDRFGKRSAATEAEEIDDRSTEADKNALHWSIELFFFFTSSSNNFRFAFLALKVANQAFTWNISICSAKINHVLRCSLSRELATGRACLRTAVRGAASHLHLQLTEPKEQRVAQRGLCAQAWKSELKSSPGPAILLDMKTLTKLCPRAHFWVSLGKLQYGLSYLIKHSRWSGLDLLLYDQVVL